MALSQLFWDVLMPWNLKSTYFSLKIKNVLSSNIWYVIYVVFWIKYWNLKLPHHCILFLFTICTVSQLFWNRVCRKKAERISGSALPSLQDIYLKRCKSRAAKIIKDSTHPGNHHFCLLPSGKRFRSMMAKTERLRRSFFPQAIRLLNEV